MPLMTKRMERAGRANVLAREKEIQTKIRDLLPGIRARLILNIYCHSNDQEFVLDRRFLVDSQIPTKILASLCHLRNNRLSHVLLPCRVLPP